MKTNEKRNEKRKMMEVVRQIKRIKKGIKKEKGEREKEKNKLRAWRVARSSMAWEPSKYSTKHASWGHVGPVGICKSKTKNILINNQQKLQIHQIKDKRKILCQGMLFITIFL